MNEVMKREQVKIMMPKLVILTRQRNIIVNTRNMIYSGLIGIVLCIKV